MQSEFSSNLFYLKLFGFQTIFKWINIPLIEVRGLCNFTIFYLSFLLCVLPSLNWFGRLYIFRSCLCLFCDNYILFLRFRSLTFTALVFRRLVLFSSFVLHTFGSICLLWTESLGVVLVVGLVNHLLFSILILLLSVLGFFPILPLFLHLLLDWLFRFHFLFGLIVRPIWAIPLEILTVFIALSVRMINFLIVASLVTGVVFVLHAI